MSRYGSNTGDSYSSPQVIFYDKIGSKILEDYNGEIKTYNEYFKMILKNPIKMLSMYIRHLINGLDVWDPEVYVKDIYKTNIILKLISYSMIFLFIVIIFNNLNKLKKIRYMQSLFLLLCFIVPSIISIPGAVETRFFINLYIIIIGTVVGNYKDIVNVFREKRYLIVLLIVFVILYMIYSDTLFSTLI